MQAEIDQMEIQMDNLDLVGNGDSVLMNPDILEQVFSHLDLKTLKSVRLVCTVWDDFGAKVLGKNGRLTFSTPPNPSHPNCKELMSFDHKLAKNITLHMKCYCKYGCNCSRAEVQFNRNVPSNFATLLPQICENLDALNINVENRFNPHLHEMWSNYKFPNLTGISISVTFANTLDLEDIDIDVILQMKFHPLKNLKFFSLKIFPDYIPHLSGAIFSPLCQKLLNAAPNLEEFDITMNFHPDLTPSGKLKELRFKYFERSSWASAAINMAETTKMLENCSDSLEKLTLDHHLGHPSVFQLNFNFSNLTHLNLDAVGVCKIEDSLNPTNLPKLTHFSINSWRNISKMMAAYHLRHPGITSLSVGCTHHPESESQDGQTFGKLVNLFPGVKEFKLKLRIQVIQEVPAVLPEVLPLKEMMKSLSDWELTSGQVDIHGARRRSHEELNEKAITAVLEGMTGWKGLKNTSLRFNGYTVDGKFKTSDGMKAAFVACWSIRNVAIVGFQIDDETLENFRGFIKKNKLPVSITNF
ncbi:uncharacterized protein LOC110849595 [Folsomia candida]|uniref:uncharacterized protein LOC110849595 n=1 Tax=Folsomia candida TaxID=158441 RepID=UPI001604ADD0|nr:uncharacterized protein LOC110849595 [Folsomia candida]